jgi:hypothetical protein
LVLGVLLLPTAAGAESLNYVSRVGNTYSYSLTASANPQATVTVSGLTGVTGAAVLAPASTAPHSWIVQSFTGTQVVFLRNVGGGANEGKCEVNPENQCVWTLIYERLEKLGGVPEALKTELRPPRDYRKSTRPRQKVFEPRRGG